MDQINHLSVDTFAWRVSFFGAIATLIILPIINPTTYLEIYAFIPDGLINTLLITFSGIILSFFISFFVGVSRALHPILNKILSIYVEVARGIPLLVQLFYVYFVLGKFLQLPREVSAILAMSICYGAYMAEIVRAGFLAVPKAQVEAALSLGMSRLEVFRYVIIPQAMRIILPPFGNEFIMMLKDSSLVSIIAVTDIMRRAREYATVSFNYFEAFTVTAIVYLLLTLLFSKLVSFVEQRTVRRRGKKLSQ